MGKPGAKAYSVINDLLKKARGKSSPLKQQKGAGSAMGKYMKDNPDSTVLKRYGGNKKYM